LIKNKVKATTIEWPNLAIPGEVKSVLDVGGYGNVEGRAVDPELLKKMTILESSIQQVGLTETNLQNNYWKLRNKFRHQ
jgi:hypothetical protein